MRLRKPGFFFKEMRLKGLFVLSAKVETNKDDIPVEHNTFVDFEVNAYSSPSRTFLYLRAIRVSFDCFVLNCEMCGKKKNMSLINCTIEKFSNNCRKKLRDFNCYTKELVEKSRASLSTKKKENQNQSRLASAIFPAL